MSRDRTQLHPRLQHTINNLLTICKDNGLKIGIGECYRTVAEQNTLYAQGRTTPGNIVTNARGDSFNSMHQWGVAVDFYRNDGRGAYNDSDGFFAKVGVIGKSLGLEWGGDWTSPVDKPHLQLPDWGSTPRKLKTLYGTPAAFRATWTKEVNMDQEQFDDLYELCVERIKARPTSDWAQEEVEQAMEMGVTDGTGPQAPATRQEVAAMIVRLVKYLRNS